jgi:hypothetical protein
MTGTLAPTALVLKYLTSRGSTFAPWTATVGVVVAVFICAALWLPADGK